MRVTLIHMVATSFSVIMAYAVDSMGQEILDRKVTINVESTEFTDVLSMISKQAKVKFTYSPQLVETEKKVTLHAENARLAAVLADLLSPEISYKVIGRQIILKPAGRADDADAEAGAEARSVEEMFIQVSGRVTDQTGMPLPGVNVVIKGTTLGTTTDADGRYNLEVADENATLVFSFIGYGTEEAVVGGRTTLDMMLVEDITSLSEIVVVGYGTQEKKEVTGAIAQVSNKELVKSSAVSVSNALAGRVPGLIVNQTNAEPGRDNASIYIRGRGTTGNTDALIVVDGVANRDGISRIDPNDIETITVLKDASAAIYGAQAANGVILITTRRGKTGKPTINYSFNQGFVSPTRKIELAGAALYARSINTWSRQNGQGSVYTDEQIAQYENGELPSTDWIGEVYKSHSIQRRHSLTLSGGTEKVKYFLSGGTAYQNGLVTNDETTGYKQYNFRSNIDAQVSDRLKLGLDLAGRREDRNWLQYEDNTIYASTIRAIPVIPATIDGLPAAGNQNRNPLAIAEGNGYLNLKRNVFNGTLTADYKLPFAEGLSVDGFAALDVFQGFEKHFSQPYTYYVEGTDGTPEARQGGPSTSEAFLRQAYQNWQSVTLNAKIKYERDFGPHSITSFLAYEQNEIKADTFYVQRRGYDSDQIDELFAGSANTGNHENNGTAAESARQNYFGRVGYTYNDRYMVQFHFRYDGSYNFPEDKRFGFFPGVSAGWRISEESFLAGSSAVSNLKLRASWGKLGNDRIAPFQFLNTFSYGATNQGYVFGGNNVNVLNPGVAANPNITWETKSTLNIGLDGGFFNNRLVVELDVFSETRKDILAPRNVTVPNYTGLDLPDENIGEVENKGFEAMAMYRSAIGDLNFNVGANITYARNKVVFIDEGDVYPEEYQKEEGHVIGSQLAYDFIGIYRTQEDLDTYPGLNGVAQLGDPYYRDVNDDGVITNADRIRVDRTNIPELQYGISLGADYKGFDFSVLFQGQNRVSQYLRYTFNNGTNALQHFLENAYDELENPTGSLPSFNRHNTTPFLSTLWLRDVSFLRLKNVELGYSLPQTLVSRVGIQNVRVYVNGYNLLTFDKLKKDGLTDPESVDIEGWQFPHTRSINFGLNLTF